ncbi:MAG: hypothetical protein ACK4S3_05335 [Parvibaculum sp.]
MSEDAARKAIKYVFHRMHWFLKQEAHWTDLEPDWRFARAAPRRDAADEATRARALVCRCVEVLAKEDLALRLHHGDQSQMTRDTLRDDLDKRFAKDGVWGLINLALVQDRKVFSILSPDITQDETRDIVERQDQRLFVPHMMRH